MAHSFIILKNIKQYFFNTPHHTVVFLSDTSSNLFPFDRFLKAMLVGQRVMVSMVCLVSVGSQILPEGV